jgi:hypothetical protein
MENIDLMHYWGIEHYLEVMQLHYFFKKNNEENSIKDGSG